LVRKTIDVPDEVWKKFATKAVERFGYYGAIKKAIKEALQQWASS